MISDLSHDYLLPYRGPTRDVYVHYLGRYLAWCEGVALSPLEVTRADVERYVHHLHVGLGLRASTVGTALTPVRGLYRFAYHEGVLDRDPAVHARRPRFVNVPRDTLGLDREQMRAFLAAGTDLGGRHQAVAYLLACMALRASEACGLDVGSYQRVVRGHRVVEFVGKGGVPARMPLPPAVVRALDAAADGRDSGPLLCHRDEPRRLSRQGLNTLVGTLARRAGIKESVTSHVLRHSCITNALESGASLRKVQDLARHAEPRTTMRYDRNRTNLDDHAVHQLVAFISPAVDADAGADEVASVDLREALAG